MSIWTATGRLKNLRIIGNPAHLTKLRSGVIGETDLICRDGMWFLYATIGSPEAVRQEPINDFLGVDRGIVNIATTSDGDRMSGARLNRYRKRQLRLRNGCKLRRHRRLVGC